MALLCQCIRMEMFYPIVSIRSTGIQYCAIAFFVCHIYFLFNILLVFVSIFFTAFPFLSQYLPTTSTIFEKFRWREEKKRYWHCCLHSERIEKFFFSKISERKYTMFCCIFTRLEWCVCVCVWQQIIKIIDWEIESIYLALSVHWSHRFYLLFSVQCYIITVFFLVICISMNFKQFFAA